MNENTINKKNFLSQITDTVKDNFKSIIIFISLCFVVFLSFQVYNFYSFNKIQKNIILTSLIFLTRRKKLQKVMEQFAHRMFLDLIIKICCAIEVE